MLLVALSIGRQMRRRELITRVSSAVLVWPLAAHAQSPHKMTRIGVLYFGSRQRAGMAAEGLSVLRQRLRDLGYVEGKTILIDDRYAEGNAQRLNELARELVASKVDVIV